MSIQMMYKLLVMWWREHKNCALPIDTKQLGFKRTIWIVKIRWYALSSTASTGDSIYENWGYPQQIHCNTIVTSFTREVTLVHTGIKYRLSIELDEHIGRFDDITV